MSWLESSFWWAASSRRFLGVELCEPCLGLGKALATSTHPPAKVVKRLVHRAGLRADALSSSEVVVGARIKVRV